MSTGDAVVCHVCTEEIVRDRTCLTGWRHVRTDDNVCTGLPDGQRGNATPRAGPCERVIIGARGGWISGGSETS